MQPEVHVCDRSHRPDRREQTADWLCFLLDIAAFPKRSGWASIE